MISFDPINEKYSIISQEVYKFMKENNIRIVFLDYYSMTFVDDYVYDDMSQKNRTISFISFPKMLKTLDRLSRSNHAFYYHDDPDIIFQLKLIV